MKYECHGHIAADGCGYKAAMARHKNGVDQAAVRKALETVAAHGIGFYRDGGDKYMVSAYAKQIAGEYGIDYRTPVWISYKKGCYGGMYGRPFETMKDFYALVREAKRYGADFVKLTVTGMLDFDHDGRIFMGAVFPTAELREAVHISEGEGLHVMAHCNGAEHVRDALEAGVQSVEHGFWPDISVIDYFLQTNAVWVPTGVTVHNLIGKGVYSDAVLTKIHEAQKAVLQEAYAKGVLIASGSDCGASMVYQGSGTDDEIALLTSMGIDPEKGNKEIEQRFKRA